MMPRSTSERENSARSATPERGEESPAAGGIGDRTGGDRLLVVDALARTDSGGFCLLVG